MASGKNGADHYLDYKLAQLFILTIKQFFENTTMHGFKYLVQPGLTALEK